MWETGRHRVDPAGFSPRPRLRQDLEDLGKDRFPFSVPRRARVVSCARMSDPVAERAAWRLPAVVKSLGWVSFFTDVATEAVYPLLPELLRSIGAGAGALGVMEGVAESVSSLLKWWAGRLSDGRARKPFILWGYALATAVRPLLAIATSAWQVVAIRTTDRIGKGLRTAPRDAMVAEAVPVEQRGYAFSFHNMMDNLGAVLGPLLAFAAARFFGWSLRTIFAATIVPGLFAVATIVWGVREEGRASKAAPKATASAAGALPGRLRAYLAIVALFTLGASADSFLMLRLGDLGLAPAWIPIAWVTLSGSKALLNIPGGRLSDRVGRKRTQVAGWLVYAAAYALFPTTRSVAATWGLLIAYGAYYGLTEGGEKALVADLAPPELRGRAFGALHAITGAAVLPANAIFGALYAGHVEVAFWASSACAFAAAIALALVPVSPVSPKRAAPPPRTS
jgi:MFS family permease